MNANQSGSKEKWDERYGADDYVAPAEPAPFLVEKTASLAPGRALCLAAGSGRNAVFLASQGFEVTAVDISPVGLRWCERLAADLDGYDMGRDSYDLVTIINYYDPALFPPARDAVKTGGHLLFQTFSVDHTGRDWGPRDAVHLARGADLLAAAPLRRWRSCRSRTRRRQIGGDGATSRPEVRDGRMRARRG